MEPRHFRDSFRMLMDQGPGRNHSTSEQSYIHMGRAVAPENSYVLYPTDDTLQGVQSTSQWNSRSGATERPSRFSTEIRHFQPTLSGLSYDPFSQSSAAENLYRGPQNNAAGHAHSSYNGRCNIQDTGSGLQGSMNNRGRESFKRKSPGISVAREQGSTSRFQNAGASSISRSPLEKATSNYQHLPSGHIGLPNYGGGSFSTSNEVTSRNVRSRSRLDLESNPIRNHLSSYSSRHYHSTHCSSSHHGAQAVTNINADERTRFWNFNTLFPAADGRIRTSGSNGLSGRSNQLLVRGGGMEIGGCNPHPVSVFSGNIVASSQHLHAPPIWGARDGRDSHFQRSYGTGLSYPQLGHETASTENALESFSEVSSSRYSRWTAGGGRNSHRNGRPTVARFQSIPNTVDGSYRTGSEDVMMMDSSYLYAGSGNLFDQYTDMRLDIDNMTYEELLVLGERIGNVNTGLSEEMISSCLKETSNFADQYCEEEACCICLEEYANGEEVGTMKNCGHNFHVSCIRKWLLMKNSCPICKAPAISDSGL